MKVLLISTYELGRQPFGLASPAAWLRREDFEVFCADCALDPLPAETVRQADVIAFYVPMHTAARLAVELLGRVRNLNPDAHICFYGLYAPLNEAYLRRRGVHTLLGGEFEEGLLRLCRRLRGSQPAAPANAGDGHPQTEALISLNRQHFVAPDRRGLPALSRYAKLCSPPLSPKITGYTETTRGCKHHCRHCPIVPVYNGRFRIVQKEAVLADIRRQVGAGAEHLTFGDPDFFNGPGHVLPIVEALHREFPALTYDVTVKIEHLLKYRQHLPRLRDSGCVLVTSAVESIDDRVLQLLDKGHTREDFIRAVRLLKETGLNLSPTFIPFTPWITLQGYRELLKLLSDLNLSESVSPIQLGIRLLVPAGSKLLDLEEMQRFIRGFNEELLSYEWNHPDPAVDELHRQVMEMIKVGGERENNRRGIFMQIWEIANAMLGLSDPLPEPAPLPSRAAIPYLNEPWYC
ncbi:MAG: radical SAM protein [Calditrichaceae bacterium]|nr:CUAEP/CCAEP-tail radical SAM protein [Calditrichia bacterium]NUQ42407.1 radical SAM protein [Calditrichaceae bacterium]